MGVRVAVILVLISIVFVSLYSNTVLAEHADARGKSAYIFFCSGNGNTRQPDEVEILNFVEFNNGAFHRCGYNWIDAALKPPPDEGRGISTHPTAVFNGEPVYHGTGLAAIDGNPAGWDPILGQFRNDLNSIPELSDPQTKLILRGFSFGGGTAALVATDPFYKNTPIDFDFVWLIDPVGPDAKRITLVNECGTDHGQIFPSDGLTAFPSLTTCNVVCILFDEVFTETCVLWELKDRDFGPNVKLVLNDYQTTAFPPLDKWGGWESDPFNNLVQHQFDCPGFLDIFCHSSIGELGTGGVARDLHDRAVQIMESMNNKPAIITPTVLHVDEGEDVIFEIEATDVPSLTWEKLSFMELLFVTSPGTSEEQNAENIDMEFLCLFPNLDCPSIFNPIMAIKPVATFSIGSVDGGSTPTEIIKEIQVEDFGWPCNWCTHPSLGAEAKGSLGHWDREDFTIFVNNVPPTVEFPAEPIFNGFVITIPLQTTDPSIPDVQAGFDYEIDWGDGSVDNLHGNENPIFSHLYKLGEYQITVTATDKDGGVSQSITTTVQTPFHNFSDNIDDLINDGTLNKGQGNSFNSKISQLISSFEKANNIPACNKAEAFINEVNGFINGEMFTPEQGQDLIDKAEAEIDKAGCNSENTFNFDLESDAELNNDDANGQTDTSNLDTVEDDSILNDVQTSDIVTDDDSGALTDTANLDTVTDDNIQSDTQTVQTDIVNDDYSGVLTDPANLDTVTDDSTPFDAQTSDIVTEDDTGSGGDEHLTRPTFGLSHETFETIVDSGFKFNDQSFTINDNFHTPFAQQTVNIGEVNSFEAKIYADKGLRVQEFLFGIPNVGEAHLAELGVEVWYDYNGEIDDVRAIQKSNVIDKETIVVTHEKTKCQALDIEQKCDTTNVSMVFLEPLKDKIMAVKAIDYKGRYQITYLNEGVDIAGESLNPMQTFLIPSNIRDGGLIKVTQLAKYSPYWQSDDGRMFEMNSFGSFKEINKTFERFQDTGTAYTRVHSGFGGVMAYELKRATGIFDASELISELPDYIPYSPPEISQRMTDEMKTKMLEQEEIAKRIIDESKVQARW